MARKILVHIGMPKCGSTYLQVVLRSNARHLALHGIAYPRGSNNHPGNAGDLRTINAAQLEAAFGSAHTLIFSHEDLFGQAARGDALAALAAAQGIDVQVIAFLRPFSEFVFGDYSQFMKQRFEAFLAERQAYSGRSFETFAEDRARMLLPVQSFRAWSRRFPQNPIRLLPRQSIRAGLEALLPGVELDWEVPRHKTNPSLRVADCEEIAAAMADPQTSEITIRNMYRVAYASSLTSSVEDDDPGRSPARVAYLEALFAPQNRQIMRHYGFDNRLVQVAGRSGRPQPLL